MPFTVEDKKVLRAHNFYNPEYKVTHKEMEVELNKAKKLLEKQMKENKIAQTHPEFESKGVKKVRKQQLTVNQLLTLESIYSRAGAIDNATQEILANQMNVKKRKIQVNSFDYL